MKVNSFTDSKISINNKNKNKMKKITQKVVILAVLIMSIMNVGIAQVGYNEESNTINGAYSSALGVSETILGHHSFASGEQNHVVGNNSTAIGYHNVINGNVSFAIGNNTEANADGAIVIGSGINNTPLQNNIPNSLMVGFGSFQPTLFVKEAKYPGGIGRVGIGTTSPLTTLDIHGDLYVTDDASFKSSISVSVITETSKLRVISGAKSDYILQSDVNGNASWVAPNWVENEGAIYRLEGNVGIGTENPQAQLELADIYNPWGMNLKIGNDVFLSDMDMSNTIGIIGFQDNTMGSIKLGTNGPKLSGSNGNFGIGTDNPQSELEVVGNFQVSGESYLNGNVGINTSNPTEDLGVNGTIKSTSIEVDDFYTANMTMGSLVVPGKITTGELEVKIIGKWQDEVFLPSYSRATLTEIEQFIKENGHLPGIPSEKEVLANGYNVGEMDAMLLQKIEELTLYVLAADKRIVELEEVIKRLNKK